MRLLLSALLFLSSCTHLHPNINNKQPSNQLLNNSIHTTYNQGKSILLFGYNKKSQGSEAYADWAAYLNDFKQRVNKKFILHEISQETLTKFIPKRSSTSNFSVFIKKGHPTFFYDAFIVEPQVYVAVEHVFEGIALTSEDKAFLPNRIKLQLFE